MYVLRKVGPKGQVVIPEEIRRELGVKPGSEVEFDLKGKEVIMRRADRLAKLEEFFSSLPKVKNFKVDSDALYEEEMEERHGALLRR